MKLSSQPQTMQKDWNKEQNALRHRNKYATLKKKRATTPCKSLNQVMRDLKRYNKEHGTYLTYGQYIAMVESNAEHCVCCGATIPEGRQVCPQCEKAEDIRNGNRKS